MTARTNGATVNYGVNNLNQVTGDGGTYTYSYDSNGNRTYRTASGGGYVLMVYDDENQLIRQETDTSTTWEPYRFKLEYVYDGKPRLRERKYYTWQYGGWYPISTERYLYDGMLLVQERISHTPAVTYTRGVDLSESLGGAGGIGGLMARSHGFNTGTGAWSTHSAYHADGIGNVTALYSTSTGSQVAWYRYDAFGRLLQSSGSLASANRIRFSSKPWMAPGVDDSAGMYYYGYRFYDPLTQRWLNRDPSGEAGGYNLYCAMYNSPVLFVDLLGLGNWKVTPIEIDLSDPKFSAKTQLYSKPKGFEVVYTPDPGECEDGDIVLYQIKGIKGTTPFTSYKPRVDGKMPSDSCRLPPQMSPVGSALHSYQDSPAYEGAKTHTMTAVAVCRAKCADKLLSTFYFEFSEKDRTLTQANPNNQAHYMDGIKDWEKRGGAK